MGESHLGESHFEDKRLDLESTRVHQSPPTSRSLVYDEEDDDDDDEDLSATMDGALYAVLENQVGECVRDVAFCGDRTGTFRPMVACGTLEGVVRLFSLEENNQPKGSSRRMVREYNLDEDKASPVYQRSAKVHALESVDEGRTICASVSSLDYNIYEVVHKVLLMDIETGRVMRDMEDTEIEVLEDGDDGAITNLLVLDALFGHDHVIASGNAVGVVALWDARCNGGGGSGTGSASSSSSTLPLTKLKPHTDYITDMIAAPNGKKSILTTSGDGTMCLIDVRMMKGKGYELKVKHRTEDDNDDELLCMAAVRSGQKVVCGTTSGVLNVYSWGSWNDCSDRFPGHPECVTGVIKVDEGTVVTGSSDGLLRVVGVQPNRFLGVLGEHGHLDVERLVQGGGDGRLLASLSSFDGVCKVWDLGILFDDDGEGGQGEHDGGGADDDGDDDGDDSDDGNKNTGPPRKRGMNKGAHKIPKKKASAAEAETKNFFDDLL